MLVTLFADASWCPETRVCGWGIWAKSERKRITKGGIFKRQFNSPADAELCAVANGLKLALSSGVAEAGDVILIQSDCLRVKDVLENRMTNLTKTELEAVDLINVWKKDYQLVLKIRHVKAHTDGEEPRLWVNNLCDQLAKKGMRSARNTRR